MELFRFDPPELTDADVSRVADELYGVAGDTLRLRGERSHNTRFTTASGEQYVLRVASESEPDAAIDFHAQALVHLERRAPHLPTAPENLTNALETSSDFWVDHDAELNERFQAWLAQ